MSEEDKIKVVLKRRHESDENVAPKQAGPARPPLREEDSLASAKRRAQELRDHGLKFHASEDEFDVSHIEKPGWKYQWCTWSVYEQRQVTNMMSVEARGWQPVPLEEHPEMMPRDYDGEAIMLKGSILMRIPREIYDEYTQAELKAARDQVRWKEQAIAGTPDGTLPRDHAQAKPRIKKGYAPIPIPD